MVCSEPFRHYYNVPSAHKISGIQSAANSNAVTLKNMQVVSNLPNNGNKLCQSLTNYSVPYIYVFTNYLHMLRHHARRLTDNTQLISNTGPVESVILHNDHLASLTVLTVYTTLLWILDQMYLYIFKVFIVEEEEELYSIQLLP